MPKLLMGLSRQYPLALVAVLSGGLVAGCGSSATRQSTAIAGAATTPVPHTSKVSHAVGATSRSAPHPGQTRFQQTPLGFSMCMRANGVSNFPDPTPGKGSFVIGASTGINVKSPAFRAAQTKCSRLLHSFGLPGSGAPASAQTMAKLLRIAVCMRAHGITQFPDPKASLPSSLPPAGPRVITDFDGAILEFPPTLNMQAPAYRQSLTACGAPPLGLPH